MSLRARCQQMLGTLNRDAMLRQGSPVDALVAFVIAETGRAGEQRLEEALPLCLYFGTDADRDEFVAVVREAMPNIITRKLP